MTFDPTWPSYKAPNSSAKMRDQLNGLKSLIDAVPAGPPGPPGPPGEGLHPSVLTEDGQWRAQDADNKPLTVRAGEGYLGGNVVIRGGQAMSGNGLILVEVPTEDPQVPGALWNDAGTLKISAG
jgi:hypothetical protein